MELEVEIPDYLKHFEDENKGRTASKVSKIATMFQCPSENEEKDERDGPGSATVVRTESHVARFNTARALFEKMAEKKEESKANKGFNQRRQFSSLQSSRSIPSCGKAHSRSPSPPVPHPSHQSNGHHCSSCKANLSSVSTIASISYTSTTPTFHSSAQNPSVPSVLPFKARSSSFDSEALKGKWHNTIPGAETSKSNYSEQLRCKGEFAKNQNDERLVKPQEICCSDNRVYHTSTLPAKIEDANRDFNRKYEQSLVKAMENKSKPSLLSKPEKPAKPETLIDKPLSSHLQNQQIIQRHKNWFQSFSKIKSPVTSPQKHHQQSSNSHPACNVLEQRRHSEDPAAIHNDWRRERSAILKGPGRSGHQDVEEKDGKASVDIANVKNFENASTLPSCWSPPQQYNECSSNKSDISSSSYQDTHPLPSSSSSSSANEESKRSSSKGERAVEGKTYIITDISKDTRISNVEKKNVLASQIDMKNVGVFKKESQYEKSSSSLPQEGERRNRDHHPQDSSLSEEETVSKSSIVLRQRPDISRDKEKRLKEWEKRLSQRESAFYAAHDGSVERHTNRDSFSSKFEGKYLPEPIYDKRESTKTVKEPKEYYHEDYLHRTYKTVEKEGRHTEKPEKEDEKERKKLLQIEREKVVREERRSHEIDKNIVYSEDQAKLRGKEGNEECSEIYEKKIDKQAQYPRKDKDENLESFLGKRNIAETALKVEKVDERLRIEEKREKPRRDEREREKMRREFEERERLLRDVEQQDKLMREEGEHKRPRTKEEEELERLRRHKIERERIKREEDHEKKRRLKDDRERVRRESGEKERSLLEEDRDKVRKEEKERNKMKREKEEWMRIKREMEEKERLKKGEKEFEKLMRGEEEEELERQRKEMKELERLKREEEERVKLKRKELEKLRREEEERERLKKEEEEKRRLRREIEMEKFRKEEEENERLRREVEEKEKLKREEEARERIKKEEERMKIEEERLRKEVEERLRKEEEERIWREEQEKRKRDEEERLRKEEEERLRREKEEKLRREEEERLRKEEERLRREEEERLRKAEKERLRREEKEKLKKEEEEKLRKEEEERLRREEEMRLRRKEEERLRRKEEERLRKEEEERLRREQEERLRKEEEEKLRREKEERLKREEKERFRREEEERLIREEEERFRREEEERLRREEEERLKREEEERLRKEKEERLRKEKEERLRREKEERLRREEEERLRREEEEKLKKEEEEKLKREEEEKLRREEEERLKREEEERLMREEEERLMREEKEKLRREEEEKLRREEEEKLRREEEKIRREEEEKMRREEERLQREEEERMRRKEQEENIRKVEEERLQKEKMEKERLSRVDHGWAILKGEHKEIISLREEKPLGSSDLIDETNREVKSLANKEKNIQKHGTECLDSPNVVETKVIISHKGEFERRWQAKREQLEEEERLRREKDRLEIEKTKRRIAELKRERDEIQRQQAIRLRMLMKGDNVVEENQIDYDEMFPASRKDDEVGSSSQNGEENFSQFQDFATSTPETENIKIENTISSYSEAATVKETEAFQVHNTFYENKSTSSTQLDEDSLEEVTYDHTVQSAQHKIEFCTGSYHESISKDVHNSSPTSNFEPFPSSTMSSNFEPLPPPVPPHNVDPAILTANHIIEQTPLPPIPQQTLEVTSELPEPMTPEEAEKLLSHNIIETKKSLISEALESDSSRELNTSDVCDPKSNLPEESVIRSKDDDDDDGFDKDYDSVCVESPTPDNEVDLDDSFSSFKHEVNDEGFVVRAKEVLSEDGIHYLEDGHFWIQVPGLMEEDEDDIPDTVPFHKHTKLKFSQDPIKLYSTFSVTDYDRRNDEVDPVAASAEYELEKRVEKMNVFPVSIDKGDGGLGLSIIGMGVGADAGVEKLGIFVKTINPGGATDRDGRIKVNDQIIEVDNQSLVGVTQMFAASVLKNTSGTVNFLIGRENDPDNSEVAMLIRQSLMADQERDERRRALEGPNFDPRDAGGVYESFSSQSGGESPSEDGPRGSNFARDLHREQNIYGQEYDQFGDVYTSCQSLSPRGTSSPPPEAFNHDVEGRELLLQNNEIMIMSQHLQEIQHRNEMYEEEINILRNKIGELEKELGNVSEMSKQLQEANARLKEAEDTLKSKQTEISTYQDMLEQSQGQYIILEKKYYKAKKIIKEYQSRERDFLHREEYHITQLEEKDALYNSLVKALKDRVIQLEGDLIKAQQEAGLPVKVPPDLNSQSSNFVHSSKGPDNHSALQRDPPRKPSTLINCLDPDLSDTEAGDTHTSEGSKSSTVERKIPSKEELDVAVPPTELLDNSFSKAKGELASRGGLANRQLPSLKKSASNASSNSFDNSLDDGLDDTSSESQQQTQVASLSMISTKSSVTSMSQNESVVNISHSQTSLSSFTTNSQTSTQENITFNSSRSHPPPPYHSTTPQTSTHPPSPHHQPPPYQPPPSAPLSHRPVVATDSHIGRSESSYRHPPPVARVQPVNRVEALPSPTSPSSQQQHQQTLAHQLKALLAEREGGTEAPHDGNRDGSPIKKSPSSLMEDVRRAVMQADISIGKKPVISGPIHVSSTAQVVSTGQFVHSRASPQKGVGAAIPQKVSRDSGTWSPVINSSSAGGVVLLSQRPIDSSLPLSQANEVGAGLEKKSGMASSDSNSSFDTQQHQERVMSGRSSKESSIMSVFDWNKEQVAQWLVLQGLENYVSTFVNAGITGPRLVNIDTKDLKNLGLSSDDKNKIKRKVKELRQNLEKERKQIEKENKEREKLQKKAEKLAEKAERRKK